MAAPPATDDDHLRLHNALESARPGLRSEAPAWERQGAAGSFAAPPPATLRVQPSHPHLGWAWAPPDGRL